MCFSPFFFLSYWQLFCFSVTVIHPIWGMKGNKIMWGEFKYERSNRWRKRQRFQVALCHFWHPFCFGLSASQIPAQEAPVCPNVASCSHPCPSSTRCYSVFQKTDHLWHLQAFPRSSFWNHFFSYPRIDTAWCLWLQNFVTGLVKVLQRSCMLGEQ